MGLPQWCLASRLARREVRRRPGRTLLVVFLIAVPVFGMTVGSVLVHSHADADPAMRWWRPGTDIVVEQPFDAAVALNDAIPSGAAVTSAVRVDWAPIVDGDGTVIDDVAIEDPGSNEPRAPSPSRMAVCRDRERCGSPDHSPNGWASTSGTRSPSPTRQVRGRSPGPVVSTRHSTSCR